MTPPSAALPMEARLPIEKSRIARYLQLATLFRNRISSGEWPVNERIPNVDQLAEQFNVARGTIREALDIVADEGLIERFRAKGSFVRRSPAADTSHHLETDWDSMIRAHEGAKVTVLEHRRVDRLPASAPAGAAVAPAYEMMRRLHVRDDVPYLLGRFFLTPELFRLGTARRFRREPALAILRELANEHIARARQTITLTAADMDVSAQLDVPLNSPIARMDRYALDHDGRVIYLSEGWYRGDMVKLEIELR